MAVLDAGLRSAADQLIRKFGKSMTLTLVTTASYDPATSATTGNNTTSVTVRGVIEQYKARFGEAEMDQVKRGDYQVTIAAKGLTRAPATQDTLTFDSKVHEIVHVDPVYSGDQVAIFTLHVRR